MSSEKIWLALVGIRPLSGNEYFNNAGAYVNVACLAESQSAFTSKLRFNFEYHNFKVFDIDDIETEETLIIHNDENAEKLRLIGEIKQGYKFAWGTFHTFDNEDAS
ncbi:hypothetical protein [Pedobacter sp. SYP-B3415]|uniref:hypothetical protein n=1 Tax=Pedobacter sp. SYP-B3415 TaxID=2496641 RepID=UPI00101CDA10|nr:hypothetical protein [Pedobacter sp. SYP-B3415]